MGAGCDDLEAIGYTLAIAIGISLGLIGGGGSILTVPLLVYVFAVPATEATAYSLFVVGLTSLVGVARFIPQGLVDGRMALALGGPALLGVFTMRRVVVPAIPDTIWHTQWFDLTRDRAILLLFASLMLAASVAMMRSKEPEEAQSAPSGKAYLPFALKALSVGCTTGLVGAGGGFLIIPALVFFGGLDMKRAIGTSLLVIGVNALLGFSGDLMAGLRPDWPLVLGVTGAAIVGVIVGVALSKRVPGAKLRPAFGYFVLAMALYILGSELAH